MQGQRTSQPFVGAGYRSASLNINAQRCVNFYLEIDQDGKTPAALYGTPGTTLHTTLPGSGQNRPNGMHVTYNGRWFACKGDKLYEIMADGTNTLRGSLKTSNGFVYMSDNGAANDIKGNQMLITDGFVYVYDLGTNVLSNISFFQDGTSPIVKLLASTFQDGYGIAQQPNTQNVFVSNLYDFTQWDPLDVAAAEGNPDNTVGVLSNGQDLWVFGTNSLEVWYNSGAGQALTGVAFPFQRRLGTLSKVGCSSPATIAQLENNILWLGGGEFGQGKVFISNGYNPVPISTHAIETYITNLVHVESAFAFTQEWRGHLFYWLTLPTGDDGIGKTFVYDIKSNAWSERSFYNIEQGTEGRHKANSHVFFQNRHYVSDYTNGNIYLLDENTYTDNGTPIVSRRDGFHLSDNDDWISCREFQVLVEGGVGTSGQGFNPQGMLRVSKNYGHTYSHQMTSPLGKTGEYQARCRFTRLGRGRDFVFSYTMSDPVKRVVIAAYAIGPNGPFYGGR